MCVNIGTVVIAWIYGLTYVNGHIEDEKNQDIKGFFLSAAIVVFIVGSLYCLVYLSNPMMLMI